MTLIPLRLTRPKTFTSRMVLVLVEGRWLPDPLRSEPAVDKLLREWQAAEKAEITFISAPAVSIYQHKLPTEQTLFVSLSLLYVPAVEGASPGEQAKSVEQVVAKAKSGGETSSGIFGPPRK